MLHRRFGRTEINLPVFSCGGMRFQQSWSADKPVTDDNQKNLEKVLAHAFELGINHVETARGYGTSEAQLGRALKAYPRDSFVLQSKVSPIADPKRFEANLEESFKRLQVDRLDLFAFHGVNNQNDFDWMVRPGGCYEVADRFRKQGRILHLGFSTHAARDLIVKAINTNLFDYVNLHWYYIFQENLPAIEAASKLDMGVFIISPNDKGGHLHTPRPQWIGDCAPLTPMQFNELFCLSNPNVHTLTLGASRPSDYDAHVAALAHLKNDTIDPHKILPLIAPTVDKLNARWTAAMGEDFGKTYLQGVPDWDAMPGGVNVRKALWLWGLVKAWDLLGYARSRYNMLSQNDTWFPGNKVAQFDATALRAALCNSPHVERILSILPQAHEILNEA